MRKGPCPPSLHQDRHKKLSEVISALMNSVGYYGVKELTEYTRSCSLQIIRQSTQRKSIIAGDRWGKPELARCSTAQKQSQLIQRLKQEGPWSPKFQSVLSLQGKEMGKEREQREVAGWANEKTQQHTFRQQRNWCFQEGGGGGQRPMGTKTTKLQRK